MGLGPPGARTDQDPAAPGIEAPGGPDWRTTVGVGSFIRGHSSKLAIDLDLTVEAGGSLVPTDWSTSGLVELPAADLGDYWRITVRDAVPITSAESRYMRLNGRRQ